MKAVTKALKMKTPKTYSKTFFTNCILKNYSIQRAFIPLLKVVFAIFLLVCFVYLKERTCETRKNVFYFISKALFILEIIKF